MVSAVSRLVEQGTCQPESSGFGVWRSEVLRPPCDRVSAGWRVTNALPRRGSPEAGPLRVARSFRAELYAHLFEGGAVFVWRDG